MANANDKEVEIQVRVEQVKPLRDFLTKEAKFLSEERQIDTYYTPAHRNFLDQKPVVEWLRLRSSKGKYFINYKKIHYEKDGRSNYKDEYESGVESLDQLEKIFKSLDLKPIVKVDKKREIYSYSDYEISIDSVANLGDFIEVEFKGQSGDPAQITAGMIKFLKDLGVGKILRNYSGYPFQLLFPSEIATEEYN